MPVTIREYLGDEKIAQLEGMGFLPNLIADMAKRQYMQDRQVKRNELADSGLDGKLVQGIMRGDVSEEEARNAQKFEGFGAKKHGWGLGAAKTVAGIANAAERVSDFVNPFYEGQRDEKGNYVYQNAIEKGLRPKIKSAEKLRDDYEKATGETSWGSRVAEIGTEMVADPINFVGGMGLLSKGSKLAQFGKKSLFFAGTGAASGGVMALGEGKNDEETLKNMGYGAAGGLFLGHLIDQGIQRIGKLIAKRRASKAANEADAIEHAENSEFIGGGNEGGGGTGAAAGELKTAQTMTAREFATGEAGLDEATAAKVIKEAAQGKEKSDFVDADTYADIVNFKKFENQRDYARAYGEQIEAAKQSLNNAREQSAVRYADTQRAINEYQKQGMSASATKELINAKFKPGADEINYTRAYNGGADVDPRLAGQGIFYALEKDIAAQAYAPEIYAARLKQRGFSDESAQAFTQAYVQKDINIAKDWANGKAAEVYENDIRAQVAAEIKAKNEIEGEGWTMRDGGEAKTDYVIKTDLAPNVRDLSKITTDEISADLEYLAGKHPEIFDKPSDVFRLVKDIKENPTHFFTNNRLDYALIVKRLKNNKIGKLAIDKQSGEVKHATKVKDKDLKRLAKVSEEKSGNAGIIQTFTRPGSKLENQGLGYQDEAIISQKGNLVNEKEADELRDSVSSIGDNASRAGGRQAGDEQILRQGRRDTANASQTKRAAQSDEQMEQQWAAKADGGNDAAAATKQMVEKQGSSASVGGRLAANSNAHLGSGIVGGVLNSTDEEGNFSPENFAKGFLYGMLGSKGASIAFRKMTPKLYNKILGAADKLPNMANHNPQLLGKLYKDGKDVSLNSFAGEKAITANVGKLDQAKAMLEKGADEVEIWQKTGWFKDKDGAWKFEIGDGNAKLNPGFQSGGRLGELLDHEELFKAYPELKDVRVVKIGDETPGGAALSVKDAAQREKRGIYNVTYNNKTATLVRQDLQKIDDALILEKGSNKKGGAVHIKKHLDPGAQGAITQDEFLSVGKNIREYLQKYKEPFIDESGGRIYEWADGNGVKFRVVVYEKADGISASHPNSIISFYSNRNLKKPMEFRNPQVKYDVNLKEWHKGSSAITKNADGSPKVFYHGSNEGGLNIFKRQPEGSGYGFWFTASQKQANEYASAELIPGYLKITKPFEIEKINDYDTLKNIFGLSEKGFKEFQTERQIWRKAMEKLKVRGFRIADKDHLGFMLYDKNGEYVQTPNQMLVHDVHTLRDAGNDELAHFIYDKYYDRYVTGEVDVLAAVLNKNDYDVGKNFLRNKLKKAGYDGIKIDDNVIVVFDSAQIKHVKNDGNFSDSPNIYKSGAEGYYDPARNEIGLSDLGDKSTLIHEVQHAIQEIEDFARGGDFNTVWNVAAKNIEKRYESEIARLEKISNDAWEKYAPLQKEYIKLFDGGLKDTPEAQRLLKQMRAFSDEGYRADHEIRELRKAANAEQNAITEETLQENYRKIHGEAEARNVQNRLNLDGKAHPHETFDVNPNETIVSKEDGINLSKELEKKYILKDGSINEAAIRKEAEPFIEKEYSLENFKAEFPNGKVDTPIGEVSIESRQFNKLKFKGRENFLGLIKPTLERPAFVVDFEDTTFFFKPFRDKDGVVKFASVIKERDGGLDVVSNYPMKNRKFELITREGKVRYVQGSAAKSPIEHSLDGKGIIQQNEEKVYHGRKIEEIKREHPNVERELDESIAAMRRESFNDSNFKAGLISKFDTKEITTQELGKSVNLSDKQLAVLKNDIKNADFKVISDSKIYFDKTSKDGDKKRFFVDIAQDGSLRVDAYAKSQIDNIPVKQSALEELAGTGDAARLKNMSFEVKAAYRNELDPIKKEAILKTAELNKLKKAAQSGDKAAVAKFEEFKAKNLDEDGNIKDGLSLC